MNVGSESVFEANIKLAVSTPPESRSLAQSSSPTPEFHDAEFRCGGKEKPKNQSDHPRVPINPNGRLGTQQSLNALADASLVDGTIRLLLSSLSHHLLKQHI